MANRDHTARTDLDPVRGEPLEDVFLDVETTGLSNDDEILQIGIVDDGERVLFQSLVRPIVHTEWPEAQDLHGISPADVVNAPTLAELLPRVLEPLRGKRVVIYNADFELTFMPGLRAAAADVQCCMQRFAGYFAEQDDYHDSYRWQPLHVAAAHVEHSGGPSHEAVADARACRAVWRFLTNPAEQARIETIHQERRFAEAARWELQRENRDERLASERRQQEATRWWMRWWRFPMFLNGGDGQGCPSWAHERRVDEYALLFFGAPLRVLECEDATGRTLGRYARRTAIPPELKPIHAFRQHPKWIRDELQPAGYLLRGTSVSWLYDVCQVATIRERHPLRRAYEPRPGCVLMTRSALRRAGFRAEQIDSLTPCCEYQHPIRHQWIRLFEIAREQTPRGAALHDSALAPNPSA